MPTMKAFNVLVLGPSGVGKSTWINSISNYFKHKTFEDALKRNPECVIPTSFQIGDDNFQLHTVRVGIPNENENLTLAQSTTQKPQVYVFRHKDFVINFIDVPGIGDTHGIFRDNSNVKAILDTVSLFDDLHAICILLKATDTCMTTEYQYCLNELLMHLHKKAVNNIFFVFTNSRGSNFVPGNGLTVLNAYLKQLEQIKQIKITLSKDNIHCIDNDAFRFQCAYSTIPAFKNQDPSPYKASWKASQSATTKLFQAMSKLDPHKVVDTLSINQARAMIISLIQPLAAITSIIQANAANYDTNFDDIVKRLEQNLSINEYDLVIEELQYPRTVCTAKKCIGIEKVNGEVTTFYKQICHRQCYLKNIPIKTFPENGLKFCTAMRRTENCQKCACSWRDHMHVDFNQKRILRPSKFSCELAKIGKITKENAADSVKRQMEALKTEQKTVSETMVKFASFLKKNCIFEYNNVFEERIQLEIRNSETAAEFGGRKGDIDRLRAILADYVDMKRKMEAILQTSDGLSTVIDSSDVLRNGLFALPLYGEAIKKLYDKNLTTNVKRNEVNSFKYYDIDLAPF
uniref:G domain-containing protein n=1 Tax=Panagrolaimus sp. JU765 TaxID=591449 RepID=A0AC34RDH8_9BILA